VPAATDVAASRQTLPWIALGFVPIYGVFHATATATASNFGEGGPLILAATAAMALAVEWLLFRTPPSRAAVRLGFRRSRWRALLALGVATAPLLAFYPVFAAVSGAALTLRDGWYWIAGGVLLQGGIGEELIWRGYTYRHLREGRRFWPAAVWTMAFTAAAHLYMLGTMALPVALAAIALSVLISFPLCYLFELDEGALGAVALLHFVVQGVPKLFELPEAKLQTAQLGWIAVSALAPLIVFTVRRPRAPAVRRG